MNAKAFAPSTSAELLRAIERASTRALTADELKEQRVSFVYGSMDHKNSMTRDQVKRAIQKMESAGADVA